MGCRRASGGGGFSRARKPGAAQEFWLELRAFPPGPAGRDPGRAAAGRRGAALGRAGTMWSLLCALAGLTLLRAAGSLADGREDRGSPGDRGERPAGPAGGAGLEPAPGTLQPRSRPPRRRWLLSPGAGAQQLEVVHLPGSTHRASPILSLSFLSFV
ncbi:placenta-specific protein 9 isoform X1 [Trachypithecus francoisi]|uniref:placenta-specific protein 9 isoform X1 n=1 Tax=Trachypithecus francoisi TaxID=54180 RepID=UPI00141A7443|nr:placenta-specific protein 9 isoform X1 [Trachypithecus francoisi]